MWNGCRYRRPCVPTTAAWYFIGAMPTERIQRALRDPPTSIDLPGARRASVALLIDPHENLLFVQRAERDGDPWSGHIALPGGHVEAGESWLDAALRETLEEVGKHVDPTGLLGVLDDLQTPTMNPSRVVRPHVFQVPSLEVGALQPAEVTAVLQMGLDPLLAGVGRGSFEFDWKGRGWTLPCVDLDGQRLWGMTLRMVDDLLHRIDGQGTGLERPVR